MKSQTIPLLCLLLLLCLPGCSSLLSYMNKTVVNVDPLYTPSKNKFNVTDVYVHRIMMKPPCLPVENPLAAAPNVTILYIIDIFIMARCLEAEMPALFLAIKNMGTAGLMVAPFPDYIDGKKIHLADSVTHNKDFFVTMVPSAQIHDLLNKTLVEPVLVSVSSGPNSLQDFYLSPGFTAIHVIFGLAYALILIYLISDLIRSGKQRLSLKNFKLALGVLGPLLCIIQMAHMFTMVAKRPGGYPEMAQSFTFFTGYFVFYLCYTLMTFAWLRAIASTLHLHPERKVSTRHWITAARVVSILSATATLAVWACLLATFKFLFSITKQLHLTFYVAIAFWYLQSLVTLGIGIYLFSILNVRSEINQIDILRRVTIITVGCIVGFTATASVVLADVTMSSISFLDFWYLAVLESIMLLMFLSIIVGVHSNIHGIFSMSSTEKSSTVTSSTGRVSKGQVSHSKEEKDKDKDQEKELKVIKADPLDQFMEAKKMQEP